MASVTWIVLFIVVVQLLVLIHFGNRLSSLIKQVANDNANLRRELKRQTAAISSIDIELRRIRRIIGKQSKLRSIRRISGEQYSDEVWILNLI